MTGRVLTWRDVEGHFPPERYSAEELHYLRVHSRRIAYAVNLVSRLAGDLGRWGAELRVLDVGPHFLTYMLRHSLGREAMINSLGWSEERFQREGIVDNHAHLDLNRARHREEWPAGATHHVAVVAEVIEHLHTPPRFLLELIASLLEPGGYLVIQTPNAAALRNRLAMLAGRNPFELIRETENNPGHFREYTATELAAICEQAGLQVCRSLLQDYLPERGLCRLLERFIPSFRKGLTLVCRRV